MVSETPYGTKYDPNIPMVPKLAVRGIRLNHVISVTFFRDVDQMRAELPPNQDILSLRHQCPREAIAKQQAIRKIGKGVVLR